MPIQRIPAAHYLIHVNITLDQYGNPFYAYNTQDQDSQTLSGVQAGDLIAWYVQLYPFNKAPAFPPYRLDFHDPSFFMTPALDVPAGGYSPYLPVRKIRGGTKYSLTVPGLNPISDPVIQTDNYPLFTEVFTGRAAYTVNWNGNAGAAPSGVPPHVYQGDQVTFTSPQQFEILIVGASPNWNVASPFTTNGGSTFIPSQQQNDGSWSTGACAVDVVLLNRIYQMKFGSMIGNPPSAQFPIEADKPSLAPSETPHKRR